MAATRGRELGRGRGSEGSGLMVSDKDEVSDGDEVSDEDEDEVSDEDEDEDEDEAATVWL